MRGNLRWLLEHHEEAWLAIPGTYKGDNCLHFFEEGGKVKCKPVSGQEAILGNWVSFYNPKTKRWETEKNS